MRPAVGAPHERGGTFEAAGIGFTMVTAVHNRLGAIIDHADGQVTRDLGCWGWILQFEDGTTVYNSGDTDVFVRTCGSSASGSARYRRPADRRSLHHGAGRRGRASRHDRPPTVIPVHYATFPALAGRPEELDDQTDVRVVALEPGETYEPSPRESPRAVLAEPVRDNEREHEAAREGRVDETSGASAAAARSRGPLPAEDPAAERGRTASVRAR